MRPFRTVVVEKPLDTVFDLLSDFTVRWDRGTVTTVRQRGKAGIGTTYMDTMRFPGSPALREPGGGRDAQGVEPARGGVIT